MGGRDRGGPADAVTVHHPGGGDLDEQQVQLLEAVGGAGQPAVGEPGLLRRLPVSLCSRR